MHVNWPAGVRHDRAELKLISHKLCPYVQRAVIALTEKGVAVRADRYRPRQQAGLVLEDLAARQGAGAVVAATTAKSLFESNVILRISSRTRKAGAKLHPRGCAAARRSIAPGWSSARPFSANCGASMTDRRSRHLRKQTRRRSRRSLRVSRTRVGAGAVLRRRTISAWWTRCSRRSSAISTCSTRSIDLSVFARHAEGRAHGGQNLAQAAERPHGGRRRLSRNCCTRSWSVTTRSLIASKTEAALNRAAKSYRSAAISRERRQSCSCCAPFPPWRPVSPVSTAPCPRRSGRRSRGGPSSISSSSRPATAASVSAGGGASRKIATVRLGAAFGNGLSASTACAISAAVRTMHADRLAGVALQAALPAPS